jgi:hypothetical protein
MAQDRWRCPQCGTENDPGADRCRTCGRWPSIFDLQEPVPDRELDESGARTPPEVLVDPREASTRRWRRLLVLAWPLVLLVYLAATILLPRLDTDVEPVTRDRVRSTAGVTGQPFADSPACGIYVVPLDAPSKPRARALTPVLARKTRQRVCTTPSMYLDPRLVDDQRPQLDAALTFSTLAQAFRSVRPYRTSTILGVTELDLFSSHRPEWRFVFGFAGTVDIPQGYGIISTARMGSGTDRARRLETMAMRYVGFYYFGLPESTDPRSALYPSILGLDDLDRMQPQFSSPPPTAAALRAARTRFLDGGGREARSDAG